MNNTYVVQPGDTLYGISRQYNMSAQRIRELNIFFIPTIIHNKDVKRIKSADLYRHIYMILVMN